MDEAVKIKYLNLIKEIDKSVEILKDEISSIDNQKITLNERLKVLETQRDELKSHIGW